MANDADPMDAIRKAIGDLETRFDDMAKAVFGTDAFARATGTATEIGVKAQKQMADQMSRNLEFFNMPSREDVTAIGERLMTIDERLIRIEAAIEKLVPPDPGPATGPKRTRKPPARKAGSAKPK
ncbi:hypothetical protein [Erythrobacter rubeus]|uniref:Poly(3-hydroxyalkanoate) polymerase subunit PhaE n=1 Tax=Erythrobacter rubeus TaxID=2760803 RepID=A0ABR8KXW3_9SPHN|nr:hypothetical protein [Erythrobacter rubeus]MBD2843056.1 hypothetical protein [Erythrobacter rubeus]